MCSLSIAVFTPARCCSVELLDFLVLGRDTDDPESEADRHVVKTGILESKISRKQVTVKIEGDKCSVVAVRAKHAHMPGAVARYLLHGLHMRSLLLALALPAGWL